VLCTDFIHTHKYKVGAQTDTRAFALAARFYSPLTSSWPVCLLSCSCGAYRPNPPCTVCPVV
jgi:hypothetical protein